MILNTLMFKRRFDPQSGLRENRKFVFEFLKMFCNGCCNQFNALITGNTTEPD